MLSSLIIIIRRESICSWETVMKSHQIKPALLIIHVTIIILFRYVPYKTSRMITDHPLLSPFLLSLLFFMSGHI